MPSVKISVVVSTFQRPGHLQRCLLSIARQRDIDLRAVEIVVTDDGSRDSTKEVVAEFSARTHQPVTWISTHHQGFRLARSRNRAIHLCRAPYLLFVDGDCVLPPDHLYWHLHLQRDRVAICGDSYRLEEAESEMVTATTIQQGIVDQYVSREERARLRNKALRARFYSLLRFRMRPRMTGNNIGIWRSDFEAINGFDEAYVGWGFEDRDFQRRLAKEGVRFRTILHRSPAYHLWHPSNPSFSRNGMGTANREYYLSMEHGPSRCIEGFDQHDRETLDAEVLPGSGHRSAA